MKDEMDIFSIIGILILAWMFWTMCTTLKKNNAEEEDSVPDQIGSQRFLHFPPFSS